MLGVPLSHSTALITTLDQHVADTSMQITMLLTHTMLIITLEKQVKFVNKLSWLESWPIQIVKM